MKILRCIKDYMECADCKLDTTNNLLFATGFQKSFVNGNRYRLIHTSGNQSKIQNESGGISVMDTRIMDNYFVTEIK